MSGLSSPLQPSPRPVAPSPARKKAKSSNGEKRGIARTLSQLTEPGTRAETLLPDTLDEPLPHVLSACSASCFSHFSISTAPLSIPRPDPSTSPNVAVRLSGMPRPAPGTLSNSWTSSSTCAICSASCFGHFFISAAPSSIPRPNFSTSPNVAATLSGIPRPEPGTLSNTWTSSSTCVICSASCSSHFSISAAPSRIPRPDPSTSLVVAARLSGIPRPELGTLSNSWTSSCTCVICSVSCFSHVSIFTAPLRIPRPDSSISPNVAARLSGIPRPEPGALSNVAGSQSRIP